MSSNSKSLKARLTSIRIRVTLAYFILTDKARILQFAKDEAIQLLRTCGQELNDLIERSSYNRPWLGLLAHLSLVIDKLSFGHIDTERTAIEELELFTLAIKNVYNKLA